MIQEIRLTVRLKPLMGIRARMRAEDQGITCSEYLRALIENDFKMGGKADALAELNTEITLVNGMMVRRLLTEALGPEEAKKVEAWVSGKAADLVGEGLHRKAWGA